MIPQVGQGLLGVAQQAARWLDEHSAFGGEFDATRRPFKEARTDLFF